MTRRAAGQSWVCWEVGEELEATWPGGERSVIALTRPGVTPLDARVIATQAGRGPIPSAGFSWRTGPTRRNVNKFPKSPIDHGTGRTNFGTVQANLLNR